MNWDNYDKWRLASPEENDNTPEVFATKYYDLYSCSEDDVAEFDELVEKAKLNPSIYLLDKSDDLLSIDDYVESLLGDNFWNRLHNTSWEAIEVVEQKHYDDKMEADERKGEEMREARRNGDYE